MPVLRETVIFKVLGATRKRILDGASHRISGARLRSARVISLLFGRAGRLRHCHLWHGYDLCFSWGVLLEIVALVLLLILPLGLFGTWRILGQKSTTHLREA